MGPRLTLPADVPKSCLGPIYWEDAPSTLCPSGPVYDLCDGSTYDEYDCSNPGVAWAQAGGAG